MKNLLSDNRLRVFVYVIQTNKKIWNGFSTQKYPNRYPEEKLMLTPLTIFLFYFAVLLDFREIPQKLFNWIICNSWGTVYSGSLLRNSPVNFSLNRDNVWILNQKNAFMSRVLNQVQYAITLSTIQWNKEISLIEFWQF